MHCTEVMYHTDDSKVVSESCNIAAWYAKFSINSQSRLETIKLTKYRPPDVQHSVTVPSQWLRHVHETACRRLSGMHRRWRRSVMSWRLLFRSSFDNDWAIVIVLQSITVLSKSGWNLALAKIWPDFQNSAGFANVTLTGKTCFVNLSFHAITSRSLRGLARQCVHGGTRTAWEAKSTNYIIEIHILWPQDMKSNKILLIKYHKQ